MDRYEFEKNWHQLKLKINEKWDRFTQDEINKFNGKFEQFLSHLQRKYGLTKEEAEHEMKNWHEGSHGTSHEPTGQGFWKSESSEHKDKQKMDESHHKHKKRKAG